jgi:divalent metal cation (Fe/Co/Zn/Cd) transporter
MDTALPDEDQIKLKKALEPYTKSGIQFHALRSRQSASRQFVSMHVLVPGLWTVQRGHGLLENIEADIRRALPGVTVFTHLESLDDPASWADTNLDRTESPPLETPAKNPQQPSD